MYKRVWKTYTMGKNGFENLHFVRCTEEELQDFIGEQEGKTSYIGASEKEVEQAEAIGMKIYCY